MVLLQWLTTHYCESSAGWFVFNFSRPSGGRRRDRDHDTNSTVFHLNVTCGMVGISHSITKETTEHTEHKLNVIVGASGLSELAFLPTDK